MSPPSLKPWVEVVTHTPTSLPSGRRMVARADSDADTSAWERELDERVSGLYGLMPEEVALVEKDGQR